MTSTTDQARLPRVVMLDLVPDGLTIGDGVHWTLEDGWDFNMNLVHLDPGSSVAAHVNNALDLAVVVLSGAGQIRINKNLYALVPHVLAAVPRGAERAIEAGEAGITYVTLHRRRGPLEIGPNRTTEPAR